MLFASYIPYAFPSENRVLQESLCGATLTTGSPVIDDNDDSGFRYVDPDLAMALRLSRHDQEEYELELQREQEMLEQALKLSLQEN